MFKKIELIDRKRAVELLRHMAMMSDLCGHQARYDAFNEAADVLERMPRSGVELQEKECDSCKIC